MKKLFTSSKKLAVLEGLHSAIGTYCKATPQKARVMGLQKRKIVGQFKKF